MVCSGVVVPFDVTRTHNMRNAVFAHQMAVSVEEVIAAVGPPVDGASSVEEASAAHEVRARVDAGDAVDFFFMVSYTAAHVVLLLFPWVVLRYRHAESAQEARARGESVPRLPPMSRRGRGRGGEAAGGEEGAAEGLEVHGVPYLSLGLFLAFAALMGDAAETLQQFRLNAMAAATLRGSGGAEAIQLMALSARMKWGCLALYCVLSGVAWWHLGGVMVQLAWAAPKPAADAAASAAPEATGSARRAHAIRILRAVRAWVLRVSAAFTLFLAGLAILVALALRPFWGLPLRAALHSFLRSDALLGDPSRWADGRWLVEAAVPLMALAYISAFLAAISFEVDLTSRTAAHPAKKHE
jgi:hypothetical protein